MNGAISGSLSCFWQIPVGHDERKKKSILAFVDSLFVPGGVPELCVCDQTELPRRRDDIHNKSTNMCPA